MVGDYVPNWGTYSSCIMKLLSPIKRMVRCKKQLMVLPDLSIRRLKFNLVPIITDISKQISWNFKELISRIKKRFHPQILINIFVVRKNIEFAELLMRTIVGNFDQSYLFPSNFNNVSLAWCQLKSCVGLLPSPQSLAIAWFLNCLWLHDNVTN